MSGSSEETAMDRSCRLLRDGAALLALGLLAGTAACQPAARTEAAASQPSGPSKAVADAYAADYASSQAQFDAIKAANGDAKPDKVPDWSGVWTRNFEKPPFFAFGNGAVSDPTLTPEYGQSTAQLTPEYQAKFEKKKADLRKGIEWDQLSDCLPAGFPRWLTEPFLREFITTPSQTWLITEQQSEVRRVYTDGRGHVPADEAYPLWEGDSIGFWSGDTLVVHTTNLKPGQYQRGQPDYSDQTTTVEMIRRISPTVIEDKITIYDPKSLTKPYRAVFTYDKVNEPLRINMWSCNENNNVVKTATGASDFVLPGEPGYKDPNTVGQAPKR
jgi:hypothetical protein